MSKVRKFLSEDGTVRIATVNSTKLVEESIRHHDMSMLAACLCGRAQTGAVLLASQLKDKQKVGLYFKGNGPIGLVFAESNFESEFSTPSNFVAVKLSKKYENIFLIW